MSADGGYEPFFSSNGDQIFYRSRRRIMAVSFAGGGAQPTIGKSSAYVAFDFADVPGWAYMLAPDGRFLIKLLPSYAPRPKLRVLTGALSPARLRTMCYLAL